MTSRERPRRLSLAFLCGVQLSLLAAALIAGCAHDVALNNRLPTAATDQDRSKTSVLLKAGSPKYPASLRAGYIEGIVLLEYEVAPTGKTQNARVLFSEPAVIFDGPAIDSIADWTFLPKLEGGVAVSSLRRDVLTFCVNDSKHTRSPEERFRACRSDADRESYIGEKSKDLKAGSTKTS